MANGVLDHWEDIWVLAPTVVRRLLSDAEFLGLLSRHDGSIGRLAAHRLDAWGVEGARERLIELMSDSCHAYVWDADRYGSLPEPVMEALAGAE